MTEAPLLTIALRCETEAGEITGYSSELLVPKWFAKNPDTTHDEDRGALIGAARTALAAMQSAGAAATVFDHWWHAQRTCVEAESVLANERLVRMFGVSLIERAMLDAVCRGTSTSFDGALRAGHFGLRFGAIEDRLDGWSGASLAPATDTVRVRHTVGLVDALDASDVPPEDDLGDEHPLCLAADITTYGLDCFKLKVSGNAAADRARLERIAELTPNGAAFTLDGNEQYADPSELANVLDDLDTAGTAASLFQGLIAIEQPVHRAHTFDPQTSAGVARLAERAPVIIDEADADLGAYPAARALGYGGVSMKACKGVLRALLNRARIDADGEGLQSAEDLTNLPALPLHQDLAIVASLGLADVERNGHHYFRGQDHLEPSETEHLLRYHASLYQPDGRLRIEQGRLDLSTFKTTCGYGYDGPVATDQQPDDNLHLVSTESGSAQPRTTTP